MRFTITMKLAIGFGVVVVALFAVAGQTGLIPLDHLPARAPLLVP